MYSMSYVHPLMQSRTPKGQEESIPRRNYGEPTFESILDLSPKEYFSPEKCRMAGIRAANGARLATILNRGYPDVRSMLNTREQLVIYTPRMGKILLQDAKKVLALDGLKFNPRPLY